MKSKKIKLGFYEHKKEGWMYFYSPEIEKFLFLGDKSEDPGFAQYDMSFRKELKYVGHHLDVVVAYRVKKILDAQIE